jgi:hypothetical protein
MTATMIVQIGQDIPYTNCEELTEYMRSMLKEDSLKEQESTFLGYSTDDGGLHSIYLKTLKATAKHYFARITILKSSGLVSKITICSE